MRIQQSFFYQRHSSRPGYHTRTYWLQCCFNLITKLLVYFQQKTIITLNDCLDPQIVPGFSAHTPYHKCFVAYVVSYFCARNIFAHANTIEINK